MNVFQKFEKQLQEYPHSVVPFVDTCGYDDGNPIRTTDLHTMVTDNEREAVHNLKASLDA